MPERTYAVSTLPGRKSWKTSKSASRKERRLSFQRAWELVVASTNLPWGWRMDDDMKVLADFWHKARYLTTLSIGEAYSEAKSGT